jgi:hypothetical protein
MKVNIVYEGDQITLRDLPEGSLFKYNNTIALKTEYRTDRGFIEAYIVGSGETFCAGPNDVKGQGDLLVTPINIK